MKPLALTIPLLCLLATEVSAADFEFISFTGHRFGNTLETSDSETALELNTGADWGFIVGSPATEHTRYELLYSHQDAGLSDSTDPNNAFDLDVHYLQLGGTVDVSRRRFTPFLSGGLGMTYMNPNGVGLEDETHLSLSIGGGLKWYPTESFGLRFEVRGYGTLTDGNSQIYCEHDCDLRLKGDILPQYETNLGLIFRF